MNTSEATQRFNVSPERRLEQERVIVGSFEKLLQSVGRPLTIRFPAGHRFYNVFSGLNSRAFAEDIKTGLSLCKTSNPRERTFILVGSGFDDRYFARLDEVHGYLDEHHWVPIVELPQALYLGGNEGDINLFETMYSLNYSWKSLFNWRFAAL